jgi:hypothetical protein
MVMAFLRAHWPKLACALAGALAGYFLHQSPSPPATQLEDVRGYTSDVNEQRDVHQDAGPKDVKARWTLYRQIEPLCSYGPPQPTTLQPSGNTAPCPVAATFDFEEHDGTVKTDTHTTATEHDHGERKTDLKITPSDQPRFGVGAGWMVSKDTPYVTADVRVFGQLWLQGIIVPEPLLHGQRPDFGFGFRVSFR